MALEDRCSPQSAPSPPGIPHSPHSTSSPSPIILDMSMHSQHHHHQTLIQHHLQQQHQLQQQQHISAYDQKMSLHSRNFDRLSPHSDGVATIKEEESDHDQDQETDDQLPPPAHHQPPPQLPFSITNILSDCFGKHKSSTSENKPIFRPYEVNRSTNQSPPPNNNIRPSAFTRLTQPVEVLDYSRQQQIQNHHAAAAAAMMVERANFLNCFNPAAYPRIHEEILNSTRKFNKSAANVEKIPPLGSLCKTVSQIGQQQQQHQQSQQNTSSLSCMSSPPPASNISSSSSSTSASPSCRLPPTSPQPIPPPSVSRDSGMESSDDTRSESGSTKEDGSQLWPAWVYCTRYSDRPSSGPRYRRPKKPKDTTKVIPDEKRPRTAFSSDQLARLKREFNENRYLTERRRQALSSELGLNEAQIKIWFQNKRAKIKKSTGTKNPLALQLMAQGLYNHTTVPLTKEEEELEMRMNGQLL